MTVRSDDNKHLLLGRSILKYHRVGEQSYKSDGYFVCVPLTTPNGSGWRHGYCNREGKPTAVYVMGQW